MITSDDIFKNRGTTATKDACSQFSAPSSCFVTTYSTTTPFTWPAVGTATTTSIRPSYTATIDLPLAPGTLDSCGKSYTQYFNTSSDSIINLCSYVAFFYDCKHLSTPCSSNFHCFCVSFFVSHQRTTIEY